MLDTLITSKTRIKLLLKFFLNPDTQAYLKELAAEFGESSNGIRVELNRLTEAKLLISQPVGRTVLFTANTCHAMFEDIRNVVQKYVGIDRLIIDLVQRLGNLKSAYIIGDYAKGKDSGLIDLVLVGRVNQDTLASIVEKTGTIIGRKIRTLVLSPEEFIKLKKQLDIDHSLPVWGKQAQSNRGKN